MDTLKFADDIVLAAYSFNHTQTMLRDLYINSKSVGIKMNSGKNKFMTNLVHSKNIAVDSKNIEPVSSYKYIKHEIKIGRGN